MENRKQYGAIDIGKYVSALLVVAIHTFPFWDVGEEFNTLFIAIVCRLAVPFFFVCSAFFFFGKVRREDKDEANQLYRYMRRLVQLYLVWTIIYIPYTIWNYTSAGISWVSPLAWLRDFFLNGSYYHLWFLPALILGTLIVYRLWLVHSLRRCIVVSLVLYLIGYTLNIYAPLWQALPETAPVYAWFEKTLVTARDGLFFAPVFLTIGLFAAKTRPVRKSMSVPGLVLSMLCLVAEVNVYNSLGFLNDHSCMFLSLLPASYFLFEFLIRLKIQYRPLYKDMRMESTLIYVSHILFARILLLMLPNDHMVVYFLTLFFSQTLAWFVIRFRHVYPWLQILM